MIPNLNIPFGLAGTSIGMGLVGEHLASEGLQEGGAIAGKFIKPAVNISMGGTVIRMLRGFNKGGKL